MKELIEILSLDKQIAEKSAILKKNKAQIDIAVIELSRELGMEDLKSEIDDLKICLEESLSCGALMFEEVKKIDWEGYEFKIKKGVPLVQMKEGVDLTKIPEKFVRTKLEPDKNAIKKAPLKEIEVFASIEVSPDKLVYKLI